MLKEKMSLTDQVRKAARGYRGEAFKVHDLADKMNLDSKQKKRVYNILNHMVVRDGEAEKVKPGVYRYIGRKKVPLEQVAWSLLRARKKMTVAELQELSGMSEHYARLWFKMLEKRGVVKAVGGGGRVHDGKPKVWQLSHDPVKMPANTVMLERHRQRKANRIKALDLIEEAEKALCEARELLMDGGEECDEAMVG